VNYPTFSYWKDSDAYNIVSVTTSNVKTLSGVQHYLQISVQNRFFLNVCFTKSSLWSVKTKLLRRLGFVLWGFYGHVLCRHFWSLRISLLFLPAHSVLFIFEVFKFKKILYPV
jgi:hypothetical protein